jgi:SAM-dependent methyltransferase
MTVARVAPDPVGVEAFAGRIIGDAAGCFATLLSMIGDRLGLFKSLADDGPATSAELAERTGTHERHVREWCCALTAAGYLRHDPASERFELPPEHVPALAEEAGPGFICGSYHELKGIIATLDNVIDAFRHGGGVRLEDYPAETWDGLDRFTATWHENFLLSEWIPAIPAVREKLERGALVADVGCGRGRAAVKMAQAFPRSRFVGYDVFGPVLEDARRRARMAGVDGRVTFHQLDVATGLPESYDVITTFDVIHDSVDPLGMLRSIRRALKPDGRYVMLEIHASEKLEDNRGPLGTFLYGFSTLHCMQVSLAYGGAGLGTCGMHEPNVRRLCAEAGFSEVRRAGPDHPINALFEVIP